MVRIRIVKEHPLLIVEDYGGSGIRRMGGRGGRGEGDENCVNARMVRYLVAADLHIGFEHELTAKGVRIDASYVDEMLDEMLSVVRDERCNGIILLGDIKDSIRGISREEWKSIPSFIDGLVKHVDELYIVPGNHDSYLRRLLPYSVRVMGSKGMLIDDTLLIHGHTVPKIEGSGIRRVVMGHVHPIIKGESILSGERVWMILKVKLNSVHNNRINRSSDSNNYDNSNDDDYNNSYSSSSMKMFEIVVMPAFNRYLTSIGARYKGDDILRVLWKDIKIVRAVILTLDGSIVGDENTLQRSI
ncbi:hypothetical protein HRbin04_00107 [archaeon HR04]|nr:hypothetical protein HRbin04_00107 [archaeon HR04]